MKISRKDRGMLHLEEFVSNKSGCESFTSTADSPNESYSGTATGSQISTLQISKHESSC